MLLIKLIIEEITYLDIHAQFFFKLNLKLHIRTILIPKNIPLELVIAIITTTNIGITFSFKYKIFT